MRFCEKCGKEIVDDSLYCTYCGHKVTRETTEEKQDEKVENIEGKTEEKSGNISKDMENVFSILIKIFLILSCVLCGMLWFLIVPVIALAWMIPMTVISFKKIEKGGKYGLAFAICVLIFVSRIAGILMIVNDYA